MRQARLPKFSTTVTFQERSDKASTSPVSKLKVQLKKRSEEIWVVL